MDFYLSQLQKRRSSTPSTSLVGWKKRRLAFSTPKVSKKNYREGMGQAWSSAHHSKPLVSKFIRSDNPPLSELFYNYRPLWWPTLKVQNCWFLLLESILTDALYQSTRLYVQINNIYFVIVANIMNLLYQVYCCIFNCYKKNKGLTLTVGFWPTVLIHSAS